MAQIFFSPAGRPLLAAFCFAALMLLAFGGAGPADARDVPGYKGYVNDYGAMMSAGARAKLERDLEAFDRTDSTQVAILTIDSLEGDSLEDFSIRVVEQWKIGQKGKDNGVLFLAVKNDRKMRIEVGRGLEHVLTDLAAGRIIDGVVSPRFKQGRFDEGFEAGTLALIQTTRGEYKPAAVRTRRGHGREEPPLIFKFFFFGLAFVAFLGSNSKKLGILAGGILFPLLFFFGMPGSVSWVILLLLLPVGALSGLLLPLLLSGMMRHGGGFYSGGGGFGGSGGGFGGFGGGGFGGGGASGGW